MASPPPLQPTVAVAIYRALLRSCRNGRTPEVFGPKAATAWAKTSAALSSAAQTVPAVPDSPESVLTTIRHLFDTPIDSLVAHNIELPPPFEVLREANSRSLTLLPNSSALPTRLPIFDYEHAALLPGEETTFRFFEPRYKRLVEASTGDSGAGGWFLLRMRLPYYSILARIVAHEKLPNGDYAVHVAAGPRVSVLVEDGETVAMGAPSLVWAEEYELKGDDVPEDNTDYGVPKRYEDLHGMRQGCMDLLLDATTITNLTSVSMPPLDPEAFSFWALRFVMGDADVSMRMKWLACRSTSRRLLFVIELLESFAESRNVSTRLDGTRLDDEEQKSSGD